MYDADMLVCALFSVSFTPSPTFSLHQLNQLLQPPAATDILDIYCVRSKMRLTCTLIEETRFGAQLTTHKEIVNMLKFKPLIIKMESMDDLYLYVQSYH